MKQYENITLMAALCPKNSLPKHLQDARERFYSGIDREKYEAIKKEMLQEKKSPPEKLPPVENDLSKVRNKNPFRLHRGISKKIIRHKHARSFYAWLELKPLFTDSVIRSDDEVEGFKTCDPKLPYKKIAEFLKIGTSTVRLHFRILKKYKLIKYDRDKNIHLASYDTLATIFKHDEKRKYKLPNDGETQFILKRIAEFENLAKQDFTKRQKMFHYLLFDILFQRKNHDSPNAQSSGLTDEMLFRLSKDKRECVNFFSKGEIRKFRKHFNDNYESYEAQHWKIFNSHIQQTIEDYPEINMQVTLSNGGIARLFGLTSKSGGQYQKNLMHKKGLLFVEQEIQEIRENSPAVYEAYTVGSRSDIRRKEYTYRKQAKVITKYWRTCPDFIRPVFPESFIEDNFLWRMAKTRACHLVNRKDQLSL